MDFSEPWAYLCPLQPHRSCPRALGQFFLWHQKDPLLRDGKEKVLHPFLTLLWESQSNFCGSSPRHILFQRILNISFLTSFIFSFSPSPFQQFQHYPISFEKRNILTWEHSIWRRWPLPWACILRLVPRHSEEGSWVVAMQKTKSMTFSLTSWWGNLQESRTPCCPGLKNSSSIWRVGGNESGQTAISLRNLCSSFVHCPHPLAWFLWGFFFLPGGRVMCTCMESVINQQLDSMRHHLSFHGCQKTTNLRT